MFSIRELLNERYAPLRGLSDRSVRVFCDTIDRLEEFLGRTASLEDFTDLTMAKFLRWRGSVLRKGRLVAPATVAKDRAHLVALANYAAKKRLIAEFIDFPKIRVPLRAPRAYTVEDVSKLIRAARVRQGMIGDVPSAWLFMTLIRAEWETGERIGGLLRLEWPEVDLQRNVVTILGENRKDRITTLERNISQELADLMRPQLKPAGLVWPWLKHRKEQSFFDTFRLLCLKAGVEPRGTHAIRKASGSYVKANGGDASEHLAHKNPRITRDHYLDSRIIGRQSALGYLPKLDVDGDPKSPSGDGVHKELG